jgi:hypothetical protein
MRQVFYPRWPESCSGPRGVPDLGVIALAVELGVGQHQADARLLGSRFDELSQIGTIVPRPASRDLRQHKLLIQIHHVHPLQTVPPQQRFPPEMMHASHKKGAERSLCQARRVHCDTNSSPSFSEQVARSAQCFADGPVDRLAVEPSRKAIQRREIEHAHQPSAWRDSRCSPSRTSASRKGLVLVAHQADNG